jgi:hypothetical protein
MVGFLLDLKSQRIENSRVVVHPQAGFSVFFRKPLSATQLVPPITTKVILVKANL